MLVAMLIACDDPTSPRDVEGTWGAENVRLTISVSDALFETTQDDRYRLLSSVLVQVGTTDALRGLHRAIYTDDPKKAGDIRQKLASFSQRSPGFPQLDDARGYSRNEQWQEAEEAYSAALELDPEMLEA